MDDFHVEPLSGLCENYILEHFEEFPVSHLSLLPLSKRRDLLWRLPIADVCLWLENTDFINDLDMAVYWKFPCGYPTSLVEFPKDSDIERYISERWPSEVQYAKARLYGRVATSEIGCLGDDHDFILPDHESTYYDSSTLAFLYGVRTVRGCKQLILPPRYKQEEKLRSSWPLNEQQEQDIVDAIVRGFNSEHPKMLPEIQVLTEPHCGCDLRDTDLSLLVR